jgi:hypothetical protein
MTKSQKSKKRTREKIISQVSTKEKKIEGSPTHNVSSSNDRKVDHLDAVISHEDAVSTNNSASKMKKRSEKASKKKKNSEGRDSNHVVNGLEEQQTQAVDAGLDNEIITQKEKKERKKERKKRKNSPPPDDPPTADEKEDASPTLEGCMVSGQMVLIDRQLSKVYSAMDRLENGELKLIGKLENGEVVLNEEVPAKDDCTPGMFYSS